MNSKKLFVWESIYEENGRGTAQMREKKNILQDLNNERCTFLLIWKWHGLPYIYMYIPQ